MSKTSKNFRYTLWTIILSMIVLIISDSLFQLLTGVSGLMTLLSNIKSEWYNDVFILVATTASIFLINNLKREDTSIKSIMLVTPLVILSLSWRINHGQEFTSFSMIPQFKYVDSILVILSVILYDCIGKLNHTKDDGGLAQKAPDVLFDDDESDDLLGRRASVRRTARILMSNNNEKGAFGVAVTGGWGSGKSWYMKALQKELEANNRLCFTFRPWLYKDKDITLSFCKKLQTVLKGEGVEIDNLQNLIASLLKDMGGYGALSFLMTSWHKPSREEIINDIKEELSQSHKQIFVFMDECDRLSAQELLQVFSLIRNVCDFPNICYILSYDTEVVNHLLGNEKSGIKYVSKMINLSIPLERIDNEMLKSIIQKIMPEKVARQISKDGLQIPYLSSYLPTVREVKHYLNVLSADIVKQKEIFDKAFLSYSDWLILELIKYKNLDLYRKLKYAPSEILSSEEGGWNGKCWKYVVEYKKKGKDYDSLLEILFPGKIENNDSDRIVGIANKEWSTLYFAEHLPKGFRDQNEYERCLINHTFPEKVCSWAQNQDRGLLFIIAATFRSMKRQQALACLVEYMYGSMDKEETRSRMDELTQGYFEGNVKHSYNRILEFLNDNPILLLVFFQIFNDLTIEENDIAPMDNIVQSTDRPLELMALMLGQLRVEKYTDDGDYPGLEYYVPVLWKRINGSVGNEAEDTLNIIEILHDCTLEDTFEQFALPLIASDPIRWLGATINVCEEGGNKYLILKSRKTHALFGRREDVEYELDEISKKTGEDFQSYIQEYKWLFRSLKDVVTSYQNHQLHIDASHLKVTNYPVLLSKLKLIGMENTMPINAVISKMAGNLFWENENLRIHRGKLKNYIDQEV